MSLCWDKYDRQEVESVHSFEDKCASAEELQTIADIEAEETHLEVLSQAIRQETDSYFDALLADWQKRLEGIHTDANSELLMRQLRKNGIV